MFLNKFKKLEPNGTPFNDMPTEIISHILSYLNAADRLAFGATCKQFYEASCLLKFCDKQKLLFYRQQLEESKPPILVLQKSSRPFLHFQFEFVDLNDKIYKFWEQFGPSMRSLVLIKCEIKDLTLIEALKCCSSLQELRMVDCKEPLMFGRLLKSMEDVTELRTRLQHLQTIDLSNNQYLSDALFNRLTGLANGIRCLSLSGCHITFHNGLYRKYYPLNSPDATASENVLTFQYIMDFIASRASTLISLDFSNTLIDHSALSLLCKTNDLKLETLKLKSCDQLTNPGIFTLGALQKHLIELNLNFCKRITDPGLIAICNNLPNLRRLLISSCGAITDAGISEIHKLQKLEALDISYCGGATPDGISKGISSRSSTFLRELNLCGVKVPEQQVIAIAENYPNLNALNLSAVNGVTNRSIQVIIQRLQWLRVLKLDHCYALRGAGLTGIDAESSDDAAEMMSIPGLPDEMPEACNLRRLRGLRELSLQSCRLNDSSIRSCFKFVELRKLNLSHSLISVQGIEHVVKGCRALEKLNLGYCNNITDDTVKFIVDSLPRLKVLILEHIENLTNEAIMYIVPKAKAIKYVSMVGCPFVDYDLVQCGDVDGPYRTIKYGFSSEANAEAAPTPPPLMHRLFLEHLAWLDL